MPLDSLDSLTALLRQGHDCSPAEIAEAASLLASPRVPPSAKEIFLVALAEKGETAVEVAAFAESFRKVARDPGLSAFAGSAIDIVGTGGDRSGTFNLSTAAALLTAASGQTVIKHGNRSVSSRSGSADLLDALGIPLDLESEALSQALGRHNFVFLFAPAWHPAFKEIMPVRKELASRGVRTVFNLLGPLINPAAPAFELMGVFAEEWVAPLAEALDRLGLDGGFVVHSVLSDGRVVDELTTCGANHAIGFGAHRGLDLHFRAADYGLAEGDPAALNGSDPAGNRATLEALAAGEAPDALRDTVCLAAGFARFSTGAATSVEEGLAAARETLDSGRFQTWLAAFGGEP